MNVVEIASWDDLPRSLDGGALLVRAPLRGDAVAGLRRLRALDAPVVAEVSGEGDEAALALVLAATLAFGPADWTVRIEPRRALELGLAWPLQRRGLERLLFAEQPVSLPLCEGDARVAAERLAADPAARLLVRSLRAAARSTAAQSAEFDRELAALLEP
jgi:hypothetical protein